MPITYKEQLPSVEEVRASLPISAELAAVKADRDRQLARIMRGEDSRFLVIIGPCSAHNEDALTEYVVRLAKVQEQVKDVLMLVPRVYTNKPRTTGIGYKGMLHQPDHQKEPDMVKGLNAIRKMHLRALSESHLSAADEMLYPGNYVYLEDLLSYVAVGARSVENQQHRLTISGLDIPVGMKNPTSGDLKVMVDSIEAGQNPHVFIYNGWQVETPGNPLAHAVIRGAVDREGRSIPNYHFEELLYLAQMYNDRNLENPAIIVDTNHSNSGKKYMEQPRIAKEVLRSRQHSDVVKNLVKGFMIESYLLPGKQDPNGNEFGRSITDPCLGWDDSEKLLLELADTVC